ncbi:MAG: hypothetical protein BGO70_12480 [Bacteroidetes bacterium 43-93]|nr:hypothetical protein [Bacteroidota bacterium]OJW98270.1 MAG: hypothetical protein BGO70_12480 [Bacteroidetes bacterium 43-93]
MKKLIAIAAIITSAFTAQAQVSSTATQTVNLNLADAISISFVGSGTTGPTVDLNFNTVNDYANGVISSEQQMVVKSNKHFNVSIQTNGQNFTYSGSTSPAPSVQISNVLQFMVTTNNTGGSLSYNNYAAIPSGQCTIINWASAGGNQTFGVKYKAIPGFSLPGGTYTANVVYTATQQ